MFQYRRLRPTIVGIAAAVVMAPAKAFFIWDDGCIWGPIPYCTLDTGGLLEPPLYECVADRVKQASNDTRSEYLFEGRCILTQDNSVYWPFEVAASYERLPGYEQGQAYESVTILNRANDGDNAELGHINTVLTCDADPFAENSADCTVINHLNSSGADILSTYFPLTLGLASEVGEAKSALTAGDALQWDPHAEPPEMQWLRIVMPSNEYARLPAGSETYHMRLRGVGDSKPSRYKVQLQKANLVRKVGDVALPAGRLYPESWHTVDQGPFNPGTAYRWDALRKARDGSRVLPLPLGAEPPALGPGLYRIRFKVRYRAIPWTGWQERWWHFWVGPGIRAEHVRARVRELRTLQPRELNVDAQRLSTKRTRQLQRSLMR